MTFLKYYFYCVILVDEVESRRNDYECSHCIEACDIEEYSSSTASNSVNNKIFQYIFSFFLCRITNIQCSTNEDTTSDFLNIGFTVKPRSPYCSTACQKNFVLSMENIMKILRLDIDVLVIFMNGTKIVIQGVYCPLEPITSGK